MLVLSNGPAGGSRQVSIDEIGEVRNFGNVRQPVPDPVDDEPVIGPTSTPEPISVNVQETAEKTKNVSRAVLLGGAVLIGLLIFSES